MVVKIRSSMNGWIEKSKNLKSVPQRNAFLMLIVFEEDQSRY